MIENFVTKKIKCEFLNCSNNAEYKFKTKHSFFKNEVYVCKNCLKQLNKELFKLFTPLSPTNILKKRNLKEKTNEKR